MTQTKKFLGIGTRILLGYAAVIVLMSTLAVIGLRYISETNTRLRDVVENSNVKTELANHMLNAQRERAMSMHAMLILDDPFERDAEVQRFNALGAEYVVARQKLEQLPLSRQEHAILDQIRELTRQTQPEVQAVMDMAQHDDSRNGEFLERMRHSAIPRQREIGNQLNHLIKLQQELTEQAVKNAEKSYARARNLMLLLGAAGLTIGLIITIIVSRRISRQADALATQALYDPLTGLPNRNLLQDRLELAIAHAKRNNQPFAVALMDLDHFKEINDTLGHEVGDHLLKVVGTRLKQSLRADDTVARMGGDEFIVVLQGFCEDNIPDFAAKLLTILNVPFVSHEHSLDISASIGFALFPSHAEDAGSLIRFADIAMYAAKRSGQGYQLYTPEQELSNPVTLSLKSELRQAIHSNALTLYYQPKIDHYSKRVSGLEALVRWNHPQHGLLPPASFLPLAEEAGLIPQLTQWVLETALTQLAALHAHGLRLHMAVNLSARSLHEFALPGLIGRLIEAHKLPAQSLTLEITESAVMFNPEGALETLTALDGMGVHLSIDDFGTGYSSLAYLKRLPVDEIKIDKSFVLDMESDEDNAVIVRSTIELAHNLGLKVAAEGVETQDTWEMLSLLGCDHSQGYLMSPPLPPDKLSEWLAASPWANGTEDPQAGSLFGEAAPVFS